MRLNVLVFSILSLGLIVACTPKQDPSISAASLGSPSNRLEQARELVAGASGQRMKAVSVFDGPGGMVGIIIEPAQGGSRQVAWASPNLEVVVPGEALDKTGTSLNAKALVNQKVFLSTPELAAQVMGAGIVVGAKGPMVTAFMDPNCIHCNTFYKQVMPLVEKGKLRVRFLMVGFLRPSSLPRAAAIVSAKDPARALAEDEKNFTEGRESDLSTGGVPNPAGEQTVKANTALLQRSGVSGTPALLSCHIGSPVPTLQAGAPEDIQAFVASLDPGNPACK